MESSGEFWSVWESFGALGSVMERLGEFWSVCENFGAFVRVLERLGEFWSVWHGSFRKSGPPW